IAPTVDPQTRAALVYVDLPVSAGMASPAKVRSAGPPQASTAPLLGERGSATPKAREATSVGVALAGMFARGEFDLGTTPALTVPQAALVVRDGFNYVFRLNPDKRISQLKVQTGRLAGDRVEISAGLAADTRVIVSGAGFLNDGDLVRVSDDAAQNQPVAPTKSAQAAIK
ncbi:MAG: efflux RND transporter periplasmic adaptor subunit, partial [Polaromonas sp.]